MQRIRHTLVAIPRRQQRVARARGSILGRANDEIALDPPARLLGARVVVDVADIGAGAAALVWLEKGNLAQRPADVDAWQTQIRSNQI